ncbi:MAG: hypothetical protein Tsb0017_10700 [Geothermobacteraceae bacterium]
MKRSLAIFSALTILLLIQPVSSRAQPLTQRDWLVNLVNGLGWSFGLPDAPTDRDYLAIVGGVRYLRLEAEEHVRREDKISFKKHLVFGDFSGESWVSGIAQPTTAHIDFLLPISGRYQLRARILLPGHRFMVGGTELTADGGNQFTTVNVGQVDLVAGPNVIEIGLPANGAVDFVELQAPPYPAIEPVGGWRLDEPLTRADLAATAIRTLQLHTVLPPTGEPATLEAEKILTEGGTTEITETRLLGAASDGHWVRARGQETVATLAFIPPQEGIYRLYLRGTGRISISLDGADPTDLAFAPYLEKRLLGTIPLSMRPHRLKCTLAPRAGLDSIILQQLSTSPDAFLALAGLDSTDPPGPVDIDRTLKLLTRFLPPR